ncbi:MAG TPA: hypothetical protein V6D28_23075 [Leptolyngbyaceae cyanobacterium]
MARQNLLTHQKVSNYKGYFITTEAGRSQVINQWRVFDRPLIDSGRTYPWAWLATRFLYLYAKFIWIALDLV